jgi:heptose I phosphotransferase
MNYLAPGFEAAWSGRHPFTEVSKLEGTVYREVKSRRTLRFLFSDKYYFAKIHFGIGWREIIKDISQLRLPIIGARNEWEAIKKLKELNIDTMTAVAFGSEGFNPAQLKSFIVTEELTDTIPLEDYCRSWGETKPDFKIKIELIRKLANVSRVMHSSGMCHRDYYLCHFHLHPSSSQDGELKISLIDLHRALINKRLATRWFVKDIAGLYFSAMDIGLTERDKLRFIRLYTGRPLREAFIDKDGFWASVMFRATKLYAKNNKTQEVP